MRPLGRAKLDTSDAGAVSLFSIVDSLGSQHDTACVAPHRGQAEITGFELAEFSEEAPHSCPDSTNHLFDSCGIAAFLGLVLIPADSTSHVRQLVHLNPRL